MFEIDIAKSYMKKKKKIETKGQSRKKKNRKSTEIKMFLFLNVQDRKKQEHAYKRV